MLLSILSAAFSLLIAGVLLAAGSSKLRAENQAFYQKVIEAYDMVSTNSLASMVRLVAVAEISISILILLPLTHALGLLLAAALFTLYAFSFIRQLSQGKQGVLCGCAGPASELSVSSALVSRNAVLVVLCVACGLTPSLAFGAVWLLVLPTLAVMALTYISVEQLIANHQKVHALRISGL